MKRSFVWGLWLFFCASIAIADIDESEYKAVGAVRSDKERRRLNSQFNADAEVERQRIEIEEKAAELARAKKLAREAAIPYPERMTNQHCTRCHPAENYNTKHHTWLAWRLIVLRMAWMNDAPIPFGIQDEITDYLVSRHPARGEEIFAEYVLPLLALMLLAGMGWAGSHWWLGAHCNKNEGNHHAG